MEAESHAGQHGDDRREPGPDALTASVVNVPAIPGRPLGRTGLIVPVVGVGCATFGGVGTDPAFYGEGLSSEAAFEPLDAAFADGIRLFDTADSYAGGQSERTLGLWMKERTASHAVLVASKTGVHLPYPTY